MKTQSAATEAPNMDDAQMKTTKPANPDGHEASSARNCSARLTAKIEMELGQIAAGPTEINRGYWAYNSDVFRWCVVLNEEGNQRYYGCATAMANCLKGKLTRWKSNRGYGEWEIILEPNGESSESAREGKTTCTNGNRTQQAEAFSSDRREPIFERLREFCRGVNFDK